MNVLVTAQHIRVAALTPINETNMNSVLVSLDRYRDDFGMDRVHRVVQYLAQLMHESGDFRYDREIWGPTPVQARYDTRTDLGNTPAIDGDGKKYMGRTGMQLTGKANYQAFYDWCVEKGLNPPNFVANPDLVNTDPWEGLVPLWYWDSRNLNRLADQGDIEMITKKINGGMNGFDDRVLHLARLTLVMLGLKPTAIREFQASKGLVADGDVGPKTRAALHSELLAMSGATTAQGFVSAPVVADKPVVPAAVETQVKKKFNLLGWIGGLGTGLSTGLGFLGGMDWRTILAIGGFALVAFLLALLLRHSIIAAVKDIRTAVEG
ncbi:putative chitinase [Rhizobium tibeticum]|uniref:Chitinase n=1 Tax=Rhizobium tibeticum TaxID=501024 RepID=A0A1H8DC91_9HYPH|nr:peptidoglycan-binding protein [Rhizobium tibeticum]SEH51303.1 putative chitinase [Rhizobium tibeticum]SEN05001.1 putative chitinase [Rhizobium tibeticum]